MASSALRLWPRWYAGAGVDFGICTNDSLGRHAVRVLANEAAKNVAGVQPRWAELAALSALRAKLPLVDGFSLAASIEQLTKAIAPDGLVMAVTFPDGESNAPSDAFVRALEWIAQFCGVVVLFNSLPPNEPPFDRILHGARIVGERAPSTVPRSEALAPWIAPWRGSPHPLSDIEKKVATMLAADAELGALFTFNQTVTTERGTQPRVDLLWAEGRLVVELDGYESHGSRSAFARDRHRDYELMLSGYIVLRLANDEIAQDCEKALEKIRDLVRLRRQTMTMEV
ncbi:endonuclease domain-containing protein [Rhodomicrobium sp.]|uniref:endonuclease domain-containing protein n=1 Tax=Rhodomicrobium sp. TaxID=2720632 RepID=UPI0039E45BE6